MRLSLLGSTVVIYYLVPNVFEQKLIASLSVETSAESFDATALDFRVSESSSKAVWMTEFWVAREVLEKGGIRLAGVYYAGQV